MVLCHPKVRQFYADLKPLEGTELQDPFGSASLPPAWKAIVEPRILRIAANIPLTAIAPAPEDVFAALRACPDPGAVKVILLGQDPYPTEGNAHGLSFSVRPGTKIPASLKNIFKELVADLDFPDGSPSGSTAGCLQTWADQGVLLLNDVLTVAIGKPLSHGGKGWEELTAEILAAVLQASPHVVLLVWGRNAQKKLENPYVKPHLARHTILSAPHPSPLSAHTGFFGSKPFSKTNAALVAHGQAPIDWFAI
jgi:uracil-DNA glycosylase